MEQQAVAPSPGPFEASRREFAMALHRGDPFGAAHVYATDGRLLVPSMAPLDGRPSIEAFWRAGLEAGMCALELVPLSLHAEASFACEVGSYSIESVPRDEAPATERGRYLIVHRLEPDGVWRRAFEVYAPDHESGGADSSRG